MNKYHGSKFEEYLKEKGTFEEISVIAQKRWKELQTEEPEDISDITEDLPSGINRFFQWLRHAINNFVSGPIERVPLTVIDPRLKSGDLCKS